MNYDFIKNLLEPISTDTPCGIDLDETGDIYALEVIASGTEETQFSEAEPADWNNVLDVTKELFKKSKDLWVAHYMLISLSQLDGLNGITQGLTFLHDFISKYWDNLWPEIDSEDDEPYRLRLTPLESLFSANSIFCKKLKTVNFTSSKTPSGFCYNDILIFIAEKKENKIKNVYDAIKNGNSEYRKLTDEQLSLCLTTCKKIETFLNEKVGSEDNTSNIKIIINLFSGIISHIDKALKNNEGGNNETATTPVISNETASSNSNGSIKNNDDIIQKLEDICEWYKNNEPSSPVPLMLQRAINLVGKSFADIIEDVASAALPQVTELFRLQNNQQTQINPNIPGGQQHFSNNHQHQLGNPMNSTSAYGGQNNFNSNPNMS
jgi:type VI secretion system protein ImpA